MKKKQIAQLGVTLGLVAAVGVGGTLAALTAQSEVVDNTFTVGKGLHDTDINLDEAKVDQNGQEIEGPGAERVQTNTYENLEQGDELDKDPTVTIKSTAADCWVFVTVDGLKNNTDIYSVTMDSSWKLITKEGITDENTDLYVYTGTGTEPAIVSGGLNGEAGLVFDGVTINENAVLFDEVKDEDQNVIGYNPKTLDHIIVKACAVQSANTDYDEALNLVTFE